VLKRLCASLHFNGLFPGRPGLGGTRMSPFWILLELRVMEVVVATGAIRRAKLQWKCHCQQTSTQCFTGPMPLLSPAVKALMGHVILETGPVKLCTTCAHSVELVIGQPHYGQLSVTRQCS